MANSRNADPGLQPERTSLAWMRTCLGYGALMALALRDTGPQTGILLWCALATLGLILLLLWHYARRRNLMDVVASDFASSQTVRAKLIIAIGVAVLALLFAFSHLLAIVDACF